MMAYQAQTRVDFSGPYDLPRTLGVLQRGHGDPAVRVDESHFPGGVAGTVGAGAWLCQRVYSDYGRQLGQVTYRFDQLSRTSVLVRVVASSESVAGAALKAAPKILGAEDDWNQLELLLEQVDEQVPHALLQVRRRHPGVRLPATGALFDQLVNATLEQKVTHYQARHSWRTLLRQHGEKPPSSADLSAPPWMRLPLSGGQLRRVPSWQWHQMWVQPALSRTVLRLGERASSIHRLGLAAAVETASVGTLAQQLTAIPGVGPWTTAEALQRSHGAADLPAVGDFHLAHHVGEALSGRRTDDAGMLKLLEPYRPHRQRVIRLLGLSGFRHQRLGPRLAPEDHRRR